MGSEMCIRDSYDVVHLNLCTNDLRIAVEVAPRLKNSSTLLVANVDYAVEMWDAMFPDKRLFFRALGSVDEVFAVEPFQKQILELIMGREIPLIPHPVDTKRLKEKALPKGNRASLVFIMYHRYDMHKMIPAVVTRVVENHEPLIIGITNEQLPKELFPLSGGMLEYFTYLRILRMCNLAFEFYTVHSVSRFASECSCLRIPLVSTSNSYFATQLFPRTTFHETQLKKMAITLNKLATDEEFWYQVVGYAYNKVEEYGWKKSRDRFNRMVELARIRLGK